MSIGSAGSILSLGSAGSLLSIGSAGSILSYRSSEAILRWNGRRMEFGQLVRHVAAIAGVGLIAGLVTAASAKLLAER